VGNSFGRKVKQILKENGCYFERRGKGDHEIWCSPITAKYFTVDAGITSRHTANGIMKVAGIDHRF
jgi:predicted RNA binding protein YcfA (HicA-like mRNA interferase family)